MRLYAAAPRPAAASARRRRRPAGLARRLGARGPAVHGAVLVLAEPGRAVEASGGSVAGTWRPRPRPPGACRCVGDELSTPFRSLADAGGSVSRRRAGGAGRRRHAGHGARRRPGGAAGGLAAGALAAVAAALGPRGRGRPPAAGRDAGPGAARRPRAGHRPAAPAGRAAGRAPAPPGGPATRPRCARWPRWSCGGSACGCPGEEPARIG